jgi:hypothetical protein
MDNGPFKINVKKFCLDDNTEREEYLSILNNPDCIKIDEKFTYDKTRNNVAITTLWWQEPYEN